MAITVTKNPNTQHDTPYKPIEWKLTTTRDDSESETITNIADNGGGKTRYTVASHSFDTNDILLGSGVSDSVYNVRQEVIATTATTIDTDIDYTGSPTGGTLTRDNENVNIQADLFSFDGVLLEITGISDDGGRPLLTFASAHGITTSDYFALQKSGLWDKVYTPLTFTVPSTTTIKLSLETYSVSSGLTPSVQLGSVLIQKQGLNIGGEYLYNFANNLKTKLYPDVNPFSESSALYTTIFGDISGITNKYGLLFTEVLDDIDGLQKTGSVIFDTGSGDRDFYITANYARQHVQVQNIDGYIINQSAGLTKWATNNTNLEAEVGGRVMLGMFYTGLNSVKIRIKTYLISGFVFTYDSTDTYTMYDNYGVFVINDNITGIGAVFTNSMEKIEVSLIGSIVPTVLTELATIYVNQDGCPKAEVFWLNPYGVWDSYLFEAKKSKNMTARRTQYLKDKGSEWVATDRGGTNLSTSVDNNFTLRSKYLNNAGATFLEELFKSPSVYVLEDGNYVPIVLNQNRYVVKDDNNLIRYDLTYRYANKEVIQNG